MAQRRQSGGVGFVLRLSLLATVLSVMVMILAEGILLGFQHSVGNKVYAFWAHLRTEALSANRDYFGSGSEVVDSAGRVAGFLRSSPEVAGFRIYANKYGVLLSESSLDGVIFKGYALDSSGNYQGTRPENSGASPRDFLLRGRWVADDQHSPELVISLLQARDLAVDTGDFVIANFIGTVNRKRKLRVTGIYQTGIEMYDKNFAFVSLELIQHLNHWSANQFGGYEIMLNSPQHIASFGDSFFELLPENWQLQNTREMFPGIFEWLALLDVNQYITIIIMFIVAVLNMATAVVCLVMNRTQMIAILKTLGASGRGIRRIFSYYAAFIALTGILIGNLLAYLLGFLQNHYQLVKLNSSSYFIESLQLIFNPSHVLLLDVSIFLLCYLVLLLPSQLVYRQQVLKVLRC